MYLSILGIFPSKKVATGGHKRYLELVQQLAKKGHRLTVISQNCTHFHRNVECRTITVKEKNRLFPFSLNLLFAIKRNIKRIGCTDKRWVVILTFGLTTLPSALYLKKRFRIPLMIGMRSNLFQSRRLHFRSKAKKIGFITIRNDLILKLYDLIYHKIVKRFLTKVDKFTVLNREDRDQLITRAGICREIDVIPNNINVSWMKGDYEGKNTSTCLKEILFIGNLIERKGVWFLLKAFHRLAGEHKSLHLSILGDGQQMKEMETYIVENSLQNNISLHGFVYDTQRYLCSSDLLVVPSLQDSFPNVILEALHVGTPAIGSRISGIKDILHHDSLMFEPRNEVALYQILKKLLNVSCYKTVRELCIKRKDIFVFDWAGRFEEAIFSIVDKDRQSAVPIK